MIRLNLLLLLLLMLVIVVVVVAVDGQGRLKEAVIVMSAVGRCAGVRCVVL